MLWLYRRVIFGRISNSDLKSMKDLTLTNNVIFISILLMLLFIGLGSSGTLNYSEKIMGQIIDYYPLNKIYFPIFFLVGLIIGFSATLFGVLLGVLFSIYIENIRIFISNIFNGSLC